MRKVASLLVVPFVLLALPRAGPDSPQIQWNDNEALAGTLEDGTLELDLEVERGEWHPLGDDRPAVTVLAFAEAGKAPQVPGPMIRMPEGTDVQASVTNTLDVSLEIQGLASRKNPDLGRGRLPPGADLPWVTVPPGETREFRFTADARGTYLYRARLTGDPPMGKEPFEDLLLSGALIVDPPGEGPAPNEKVMVMQVFFDATPEGEPDFNQEIFAINGRPWPHTERLVYDMDDEITWRVINATGGPHPMHLHGFFYRVESRGDIARDTIYGPVQRRKAVTEQMNGDWATLMSTMKVTWSPDRPGAWLFHCHITPHIFPNPDLAGEPPENRAMEFLRVDDPAEPNHHAEHGMGGLVMGIYIRPPEDWRVEEPEGEPARIHVRADSTPGKFLPRFAYALGDPGDPPPADAVPFPSPPLVLQEGAPTPVRIVNETDEPTTVHWHGLEVESLYDGVAGGTGYPGKRSPAVMPGDSFDVALRTDRPGTYIYHTHMSDLRQQGAGLYAPLIILPEGEEWTPETDRIYTVGLGLGEIEVPQPIVFLNGATEPQPEEMTVGTTYRLRLINITPMRTLLIRLVRDGFPVEWRPRAHDGWDVPAHQRAPSPARLTVGVGETFDFTFTPEQAGKLSLEVRSDDGELLVEQPIQVVEDD